MRGYGELPDADKERLLPIIVLSKWNRIQTLKGVVERLTEQMDDRSFIADHTRDRAHFCEESEALLDPTDDFAAWRRFVAQIPNAVPVAQITETATRRQVAREALLLERQAGQLVLRIRNPLRELPKAIAALDAVEDVDNVLTVIDVGYIRGNEAAKLREMIEAINSVRDASASARIVCMATSFPRSVAVYGEESGVLEILERELHAGIGGDAVSIYGDHSSIHSEPYETMARGWIPRIDYPLPDAWIYRRYRPNQRGFTRCAQEIIGSPDWDENLRIWGSDRIIAASNGNLEGMGSPASWIAVRVNIHLHQQLGAGPPDEEEDLPEDDEE